MGKIGKDPGTHGKLCMSNPVPKSACARGRPARAAATSPAGGEGEKTKGKMPARLQQVRAPTVPPSQGVQQVLHHNKRSTRTLTQRQLFSPVEKKWKSKKDDFNRKFSSYTNNMHAVESTAHGRLEVDTKIQIHPRSQWKKGSVMNKKAQSSRVLSQ